MLTSCNGFVYSFGAALLDLDQPWKVIYRGAPYLLSPQSSTNAWATCPTWHLPCAALYDPPTGRMAIYYGGADTVTALAFCKMDEVIDFVKHNSERFRFNLHHRVHRVFLLSLSPWSSSCGAT